jgi:hypothetical protein
MSFQLVATVTKSDDDGQPALREALTGQVDHELDLIADDDVRQATARQLEAAIEAAVRLTRSVGVPGGVVSVVVGGNAEADNREGSQTTVSVIALADEG